MIKTAVILLLLISAVTGFEKSYIIEKYGNGVVKEKLVVSQEVSEKVHSYVYTQFYANGQERGIFRSLKSKEFVTLYYSSGMPKAHYYVSSKDLNRFYLASGNRVEDKSLMNDFEFECMALSLKGALNGDKIKNFKKLFEAHLNKFKSIKFNFMA